ncbi:MFS transporter [Streptomyces sp. NPDC049906]|uniref:MFS transporter n=1 Tax=Streptomyces sp. NPDC049906 TaxID=3155656 RepID=UPI00343D4CE4
MSPAQHGPDRPAVRLLQCTTFVSTLDRFAMPPMLLVIAVELGAPLADVLRAAGAYFLAYGVMQPVWGAVSVRWGLVRTLRLTLLLAALSTAAAAFVTTPLALAVTRGLAGAFLGAAYPGSLVYLGETVPARRRQREVVRLMVGVALGTALGSAGAGLAAQFGGWRAVFVSTGAACLVLAFVLARLPEPVRRTGSGAPLGAARSVVGVLRSGPALLVLFLAFAEGAVLLGGLTVLPSAVQATGAGAAATGAVTAGYGLGVLLCAPAVTRLSRRLPADRLIAVGAGAAVLACAALAVSRAPVVAGGAVLLLALAWTAMHSTVQTWATEVLPAARAVLVPLFAGALFAGSAVAAALVAGVLPDGGPGPDVYGAVFLVCAGTAVPLGVVAAVGRARWNGPDDRSQ